MALDMGYTLVDLRSASAAASSSKRWFLNMPFDSESSFKSSFQTKFFNKMARIILVRAAAGQRAHTRTCTTCAAPCSPPCEVHSRPSDLAFKR